MSKLRAAISFKHRVDEVKTIQQQKLRENIAGPILNIDDSNLEIQENPTNLENQQETNIQDDDSDDENNESQITSNWNSLINTWEQLLLQEEKAEEDAETDLNDDYNNEINEILLNNTHSALDNEAKWQIEDIFIDNLDALFFVNENTSN